MTLQYRIRSKFEDERWRHRVYLCERLLSEAIDRWCLGEHEFPTRAVVAAVLYLFSPGCDPFGVPPRGLSGRLSGVVGEPEAEYRRTWPNRDEAQAEGLVAALSEHVAAAVASWVAPESNRVSAEDMAGRLAAEVVAGRYVIFNHYATTRRDINPWGI